MRMRAMWAAGFLGLIVGCSSADAGVKQSEEVHVPRLQGLSTVLRNVGESQPAALPPGTELAGEIFGVPVSLENYYFAKRVAYQFPSPWGAADRPVEDREDFIWEQLILHFEATRRNIQADPDELREVIDNVMRSNDLDFDPETDREAYAEWVQNNLNASIELFENQLRYVIQVRKLQDQIRKEQAVNVSMEEMHAEFLNEQHHVSGEMVVFNTKEEAQQFYKKHRSERRWKRMKKKGEYEVRAVSMMTLEAYIDLWSIPKKQMYEFHSMDIGDIGKPMPFGKQWCVYRLLDKRVGDLKDFPEKEEYYYRQVYSKKQYDALNQWVEDLKASANLKILVEE